MLHVFTVGAQDVVIALPGQDVNVQLVCNVIGNGAVAWLINGTLHTLNDLFDCSVDGHNSNGSNIIVEVGLCDNGNSYITILQPNITIIMIMTYIYKVYQNIIIFNFIS